MAIIIVLTLLTLAICAVASYWYLTGFGERSIFEKGPRSARLEVPVTYTIAWWANQEALKVDSFTIDIVESKLNLFNSKSVISYKVSGQITYQGHWQPKIREVHISERINQDSTLNCDRIIEITPVLESKENTQTNGGTDLFEFKNEHIITSNHWGVNRIKFICGSKEQTIELQQSK